MVRPDDAGVPVGVCAVAVVDLSPEAPQGQQGQAAVQEGQGGGGHQDVRAHRRDDCLTVGKLRFLIIDTTTDFSDSFFCKRNTRINFLFCLKVPKNCTYHIEIVQDIGFQFHHFLGNM